MTSLESGVHNLDFYERQIKLYEEGKLELDNDGLIELADEILGFDKSKDWLTLLPLKYRLGCNFEINGIELPASSLPLPNPDITCEKCFKLDSDKCEYTKAINLAQHIYRGFASELPDNRDMLSDFLRNLITVEGA